MQRLQLWHCQGEKQYQLGGGGNVAGLSESARFQGAKKLGWGVFQMRGRFWGQFCYLFLVFVVLHVNIANAAGPSALLESHESIFPALRSLVHTQASPTRILGASVAYGTRAILIGGLVASARSHGTDSVGNFSASLDVMMFHSADLVWHIGSAISPHEGRYAHTASIVLDRYILVVGGVYGFPPSPVSIPQKDLAVAFDLNSLSWVAVDLICDDVELSVPALHSALSLPNGHEVLIHGGLVNRTGASNWQVSGDAILLDVSESSVGTLQVRVKQVVATKHPLWGHRLLHSTNLSISLGGCSEAPFNWVWYLPVVATPRDIENYIEIFLLDLSDLSTPWKPISPTSSSVRVGGAAETSATSGLSWPLPAATPSAVIQQRTVVLVGGHVPWSRETVSTMVWTGLLSADGSDIEWEEHKDLAEETVQVPRTGAQSTMTAGPNDTVVFVINGGVGVASETTISSTIFLRMYDASSLTGWTMSNHWGFDAIGGFDLGARTYHAAAPMCNLVVSIGGQLTSGTAGSSDVPPPPALFDTETRAWFPPPMFYKQPLSNSSLLRVGANAIFLANPTPAIWVVAGRDVEREFASPTMIRLLPINAATKEEFATNKALCAAIPMILLAFEADDISDQVSGHITKRAFSTASALNDSSFALFGGIVGSNATNWNEFAPPLLHIFSAREMRWTTLSGIKGPSPPRAALMSSILHNGQLMIAGGVFPEDYVPLRPPDPNPPFGVCVPGHKRSVVSGCHIIHALAANMSRWKRIFLIGPINESLSRRIGSTMTSISRTRLALLGGERVGIGISALSVNVDVGENSMIHHGDDALAKYDIMAQVPFVLRPGLSTATVSTGATIVSGAALVTAEELVQNQASLRFEVARWSESNMRLFTILRQGKCRDVRLADADDSNLSELLQHVYAARHGDTLALGNAEVYLNGTLQLGPLAALTVRSGNCISHHNQPSLALLHCIGPLTEPCIAISGQNLVGDTVDGIQVQHPGAPTVLKGITIMDKRTAGSSKGVGQIAAPLILVAQGASLSLIKTSMRGAGIQSGRVGYGPLLGIVGDGSRALLAHANLDAGLSGYEPGETPAKECTKKLVIAPGGTVAAGFQLSQLLSSVSVLMKDLVARGNITAVSPSTGSSITITNSSIVGGVARLGGCMSIVGSSSQLLITDGLSSVSQCAACRGGTKSAKFFEGGVGGGLYIDTVSVATSQSSSQNVSTTIEGKTTRNLNHTKAMMPMLQVRDSYAEISGGGIYVASGGKNWCKIFENSVQNSHAGGFGDRFVVEPFQVPVRLARSAAVWQGANLQDAGCAAYLEDSCETPVILSNGMVEGPVASIGINAETSSGCSITSRRSAATFLKKVGRFDLSTATVGVGKHINQSCSIEISLGNGNTSSTIVSVPEVLCPIGFEGGESNHGSNSPDCTLCRKGHYKLDYGNEDCEPCNAEMICDAEEKYVDRNVLPRNAHPRDINDFSRQPFGFIQLGQWEPQILKGFFAVPYLNTNNTDPHRRRIVTAPCARGNCDSDCNGFAQRFCLFKASESDGKRCVHGAQTLHDCLVHRELQNASKCTNFVGNSLASGPWEELYFPCTRQEGASNEERRNISSLSILFKCSCHRKGLLCGQCTEGFSIPFGANDCMKCDFGALFLSGCIVFAFVCLIGLHSCSNGSLSTCTYRVWVLCSSPYLCVFGCCFSLCSQSDGSLNENDDVLEEGEEEGMEGDENASVPKDAAGKCCSNPCRSRTHDRRKKSKELSEPLLASSSFTERNKQTGCCKTCSSSPLCGECRSRSKTVYPSGRGPSWSMLRRFCVDAAWPARDKNVLLIMSLLLYCYEMLVLVGVTERNKAGHVSTLEWLLTIFFRSDDAKSDCKCRHPNKYYGLCFFENQTPYTAFIIIPSSVLALCAVVAPLMFCVNTCFPTFEHTSGRSDSEKSSSDPKLTAIMANLVRELKQHLKDDLPLTPGVDGEVSNPVVKHPRPILWPQFTTAQGKPTLTTGDSKISVLDPANKSHEEQVHYRASSLEMIPKPFSSSTSRTGAQPKSAVDSEDDVVDGGGGGGSGGDDSGIGAGTDAGKIEPTGGVVRNDYMDETSASAALFDAHEPFGVPRDTEAIVIIVLILVRLFLVVAMEVVTIVARLQNCVPFTVSDSQRGEGVLQIDTTMPCKGHPFVFSVCIVAASSFLVITIYSLTLRVRTKREVYLNPERKSMLQSSTSGTAAVPEHSFILYEHCRCARVTDCSLCIPMEEDEDGKFQPVRSLRRYWRAGVYHNPISHPPDDVELSLLTGIPVDTLPGHEQSALRRWPGQFVVFTHSKVYPSVFCCGMNCGRGVRIDRYAPLSWDANDDDDIILLYSCCDSRDICCLQKGNRNTLRHGLAQILAPIMLPYRPACRGWEGILLMQRVAATAISASVTDDLNRFTLLSLFLFFALTINALAQPTRSLIVSRVHLIIDSLLLLFATVGTIDVVIEKREGFAANEVELYEASSTWARTIAIVALIIISLYIAVFSVFDWGILSKGCRKSCCPERINEEDDHDCLPGSSNTCRGVLAVAYLFRATDPINSIAHRHDIGLPLLLPKGEFAKGQIQ